MIGQTLGHYRIESKLGEGGMGVVYKALDTHLDRAVAIKVLPPESVANPERKRRFVQEAKAASALNHPNILHVYDIDTTDGVDFIAMEYVEGKTLDEIIGHKSLRLDEALKCSVQMADALAAAHAAGIVHRDVKPSNIMVSEKGTVKVLDFGLAKLTEQAEEDPSAPTQTMRPRTEEGTIVGTVAYMSPEQAQGKKVDARSDIFSFGSVLYEMVTGRRAFQGENRISTLSAILHKEPPPVSEIVEATPNELERIITRCLRKDAERRLQHMDDVKLALEELKEESDSGRLTSAVVPAPRSVRRFISAAIVSSLLLLAVLAAGLWWKMRSGDRGRGLIMTRLTSDSGLTTDPALSPDGKLVAYASDRSGEGNLDIWVQQVSGGEASRLTRDPADDREPSFSPDGQRIVFRSDRDGGGIYVVSALGGTERLLARRGRGPRFSPDGSTILYWVGAGGGYNVGEIYQVDATGGPSRLLSTGLPFAQSPVWSPDGKQILFVGAPEASLAGVENWDWWICPADGGHAVRTGVKLVLQQMGISGFRQAGSWLAGDRVVFSANLGGSTNLWELSISPRTGRVDGAPRRLTTGPGPELYPSGTGSGLVVFANQVQNLNVWWLPVEVNRGKVLGEPHRLTEGAASNHYAKMSFDGSKLLFISERSGSREVWIKDLASGKETAVPIPPLNEGTAIFNRDGTKVAYNRAENGKRPTYMVSAVQPTVPEKVCEDCAGLLDDCSSDGSRILYDTVTTPNAIRLLDLTSHERIRLLEHPKHSLFVPRFSPDDRWVSFHEFTGLASRRIYVAALRGSAPVPERDWVPITDGKGLDRDACWSPDGNLLYFYSERDGFRCIWAQRLHEETKRPLGEMFPVFHLHHARRSTMNVANLAAARLSTAPGKLVFSMGEYTGNIWMGKLE